MRKLPATWTLTIALALLGAALPASGVMKAMSVEQLVQESQLVLRGKAISAKAQWNADRTQIVTRVVVTVSEVYSGELKDRAITVEYPGGEIPEEDIGMGVSDAVRIEQGEDVILFLSATDQVPLRMFRVVGLAQGKYAIGADGMARTGPYAVAGEHDHIYREIFQADLVAAIRAAAP